VSQFEKRQSLIGRLLSKSRNSRHYDFIGSTVALMRGNIVAQIIIMCAAPILTRLFEPSMFGIFALFSAFVAIVARVGSLCYERAIVLPKDRNAAFHVLVLSVVVLFMTVIISAIVILIFGVNIAEQLRSPGLYEWLYLIPVGIGLTGSVDIQRNWALRQKQFALMSRARILDAVTSTSIKIITGVLLGSWVGGLVLGMFTGIGISLVMFLLLLHSNYGWQPVSKPRYSELLRVAKAYRSFPLYASWNALLNSLSAYMMVFLLSILFGPVVVGLYSLSNRVVQQPILMLSQSVASVYFQKSAEQVSNGRSALYGYKKVISVLISLGILPFIIIILFGYKIFGIMFGPRWETAGLYAQILSPWFFVMFISGPANVVFEVYQKQKLKLVINVMGTFLSVIAVNLTYWVTDSVSIVLSSFTLVNVIAGIILLLAATKIVRGNEQSG